MSEWKTPGRDHRFGAREGELYWVLASLWKKPRLCRAKGESFMSVEVGQEGSRCDLEVTHILHVPEPDIPDRMTAALDRLDLLLADAQQHGDIDVGTFKKQVKLIRELSRGPV